MSEWKFFGVIGGGIVLIILLAIAAAHYSEDSGRRTQCVRIGNNPCVPIVHPSK